MTARWKRDESRRTTRLGEILAVRENAGALRFMTETEAKVGTVTFEQTMVSGPSSHWDNDHRKE